MNTFAGESSSASEKTLRTLFPKTNQRFVQYLLVPNKAQKKSFQEKPMNASSGENQVLNYALYIISDLL